MYLLKCKPKNSHVLWQNNSKAGPLTCNTVSQLPPLHSGQGHPGCYSTWLATCTKASQMQTWCVREQNMYLFSKITSHQNHLLLFVMLLAKHILMRKFWTSQGTMTDKTLWIQEVSVPGNIANIRPCWHVRCSTTLKKH